MLDRWITRCLTTLACVASFALTAEAFASGCDGGGYGYRYGGYGYRHHGYRFPRAYPSHCGSYSPRYSIRYWGPGCYYPPRRYTYSRAYYPRFTDYPRYSNAVPTSFTPSYDIKPSYPVYGPVEVYEGGAPANEAARQAAWDLLRAGRAADAQRTFTRWARAKPETGEPELGYALASAMRRDHATATMAMRRAIDADPGALHAFPQDEAMRARVIELVDVYAYRSTKRDLGTDPLFMTAALYCMLGEHDLAHEAIAAAMREDDRDDAFLALRDLIDAELDAAEESVAAVQ